RPRECDRAARGSARAVAEGQMSLSFRVKSCCHCESDLAVIASQILLSFRAKRGICFCVLRHSRRLFLVVDWRNRPKLRRFRLGCRVVQEATTADFWTGEILEETR